MQLFCDRRGISHGGGEAGREVLQQSRGRRHQPAVRFDTSIVNKRQQAQRSQQACKA